MRTDPVEDALNRQRTWQPPPGFARRVVSRIPPPDPAAQRAGRGGRHEVLRAATMAAVVGAVAATLGVALVRAMPELMRIASLAAADYGMLLEGMTAALATHAEVVSWVAAAASLSLAASVSGRLREWL